MIHRRLSTFALTALLCFSSLAVAEEPQATEDNRTEAFDVGQLLRFADIYTPTSELPDQAFLFSLEGNVFFEESLRNQDAEMWYTDTDFRFAFPAFSNEERQWLVVGRARQLDFETEAILPDTVEDFPAELWNVELGTTYKMKLDNGWIAGGNLTIGSPSDQPFSSLDEVSANFTVFVRIPDGDRNAWHLGVNYSNMRTFANHLPLPGAAYQWYCDDTLEGLIGLPGSYIQYVPSDWIRMHLYYGLIRNVDAEIMLTRDYGQLFLGFEWNNDRFLREDRRDDDDMLFFYEKKIKTGIRWLFAEQAAGLELEGGYAFDRMFFEGEEYDDRHFNRIDLGDGPYAKLQFRIAF